MHGLFFAEDAKICTKAATADIYYTRSDRILLTHCKCRGRVLIGIFLINASEGPAISKYGFENAFNFG